LIEALKPHCAVCNKPVETIEWVNCYKTDSVWVTVYCHGQKESCELPNHVRFFEKIEAGIAFNTKQIEKVKKLCQR